MSRRSWPLAVLALALACGRDGGGPDDQEPCVPATCESAQVACGAAPDGCGEMLACGECPGGVEIQAPPLDPSIPTDFGSATEFLYTGDHPVQTGVAVGTIDTRHVAVLRGKVTDRAGAPLANVRVTVLHHPELGQTLTRASGNFDLAVNGGGEITLELQRDGYLPIQRELPSGWREYAIAADVVMTPLDVAVAIAQQGSPVFQVVQSTASEDTAGRRRATLLVPPDTHAAMILPDGSSRPIATLAIRGTEYTVGRTGPAAMPGALPAQSGYTYAVEWSVDEALAAGATQVTFDRPVWFYLENYLGFPVGGVVPTGYYDRADGTWKADQNGRVVKVLGVNGGLADLDVNGDGAADTGALLTALGITDGERAQLASLYPSGTALWRVPLTHFTPWDCNWPFGPPLDAVRPFLEGLGSLPSLMFPCLFAGSVIECENQVLGESLALAGTPLGLHYRSDRVPGRKGRFSLRIPVTGATVPASLAQVDLEIVVAGQVVRRSYTAPSANERFDFEWDGKDAYGRTVNGVQPVEIRLHYRYPLEYRTPSEFAQSFARLSEGEGDGFFDTAVRRGDTFMTLTDVRRTDLGEWRQPPGQLGGWSLSAHHVYEPASGTVFYGDGSRRTGQFSPAVVRTVLGGPSNVGMALNFPNGLAVAPDGTLYVADAGSRRVIKRTPGGAVTVVAGGGSASPTVEGPATAASLGWLVGMDVGPDGRLYFADEDVGRIFVLGPDDTLRTFAGGGASNDEGAPARSARMAPLAPRVAPDGSVYFTERNSNRLRRISPDGRVWTVAGSATAGFAGDGALATRARFDAIENVAIAPDGTLFVSDRDNRRLRRIAPDGVVTTIAGNGSNTRSGDGGGATLAGLVAPETLIRGPDGSLYTSAFTDHVRRIGPDGTITTFLGGGTLPFTEGAAANQVRVSQPIALAASPDGTIYVTDIGTNRVIAVAPTALRGADAPEAVIASEDGNTLFAFDAQGRHLRTIDALNHETVQTFAYDTGGRLLSITDADGAVLRIDRDGEGRPRAIVAPDGERTELTLDVNGYLASVRNAAGESVSLTYAAGGLLAQKVDPRGGVHAYAYDAQGRLERDTGAAGASSSLSRTELPDGFEVALSTSMGRTTRHRVSVRPDGSQLRTRTLPDGLQATTLFERSGRRVSTAPDGTVVTLVETPDPIYGMQSPTQSFTERLPSGLTRSVERERVVVYAGLAPEGPPGWVYDFAEVNNRRSVRTWNAASRTVTEATPGGRTAVQTYDARLRPIRDQSSGLLAIDYQYDDRGRLSTTTQGTRRLTYAYDGNGALASVTDSLGRVTARTRDSVGRVRSHQLPGDRRVEVTYDPGGAISGLTPPGREAHRLEYTPDGLRARYTSPAAEGGVDTLAYTYDADRMLVRTDLGGGESVTFDYDAAGRLFRWTQGAGATTLGYDAVGRVAALEDPSGRIDFAYDGRLPIRATLSGAVAGELTWEYDADFRPRRLGLNGVVRTLTYDADGELSTIGNTSLVRHFETGLLSQVVLGRLNEGFAHDGYGDPLASAVRYLPTSGGPGVVRYAATWIRDEGGRITGQIEEIDGVETEWTYGRDAAGRIASVSIGGVPVGAYVYDANGNRTSRNEGGVTELATYDAQDRLLTRGATSYVWRRNGSLERKVEGSAVTRYAYDTLGALRSVTLPDGARIDYAIDPAGRRVARALNGTRTHAWVYDGARIVAELDAGGSVVSRFDYASRAHVPDTMTRAGVEYRLVSDLRGSVRLVIRASDGVVVQRIDYDAFGNVLADTQPGFQPFGFAGGLHDAATGLVRYGVRDYDPAAGRWTAKDPLEFGGGDTNLYAYAGGDPVQFIDPDGTLFFVPVLLGAMTAAGAAETGCNLYQGNYGQAAVDGALTLVGGGVLRLFRIVPRVGGAVVRGGVAAARVELPLALRGGAAANHVYFGVRNGERVYVGITNNMLVRQTQHGSRFALERITTTPLTRGEARAIEQALIVRNRGSFENIRNSISPRHEYYDEAVEWGEQWLRDHGL